MIAVALLGINIEGPVVLLPLVAADSLGLSSFGVIMGVFTALSTLGATLGPLAAGHIFDATGNYKLAFEVLAAMLVLRSGGSIAMPPSGNRTVECGGARRFR